MESENTTPLRLIDANSLFKEVAEGLIKAQTILDERLDLGTTALGALENDARIRNALNEIKNRLSLVGTQAELARFSELSDEVERELTEFIEKRMSIADQLNLKNDGFTEAIFNEYLCDCLRINDDNTRDTLIYYQVATISLGNSCHAAAKWLKDKIAQTPSAPVMAKLVPEQAALLKQAVDNSQGAKQAAEQAADNSQAVIDEMAEWRKWLVTLNKPGKHRVVPKLSAPMQQAVINCWNKYKEECKNKKERSTFQGCLDNHGVDVIYTNTLTRKSYQLIELAQDEGTLQRIIHNHNSKESARTKSSLPKNDIDTPDILHTPDILQHIALYPEKSKSRQKRKRK